MRSSTIQRRAKAKFGYALLAALILLTIPQLSGAVKRDTQDGPFDADVFAIQPPRTDLKVKPGEHLNFEFATHNRLGAPIGVKLELLDLEGSSNPDQIFNIVDKAAFGARGWLELEESDYQLVNGERLTQVVDVRVPEDISPGSYYAVIQASIEANDTTDGSGSGGKVQIQNKLAGEVFFDVAGEKTYSGRILSATYPTYVQHGLRSLIPFDVIYVNTGTATDRIGGEVRIKSIFGNTAELLKIEEGFVLRRGKRSFRATWDDVPWIGVFFPEVRVKGENGKMHVKKLKPIVVTPPWYYMVALGVAIAFAVGWQIRRRRQWRKYLDSVSDDELDSYEAEDDGLDDLDE